MTSSISTYEIQDTHHFDDDFHDLFTELDQLEPFDIKKEELAAQLAALLSYSNETRSEFSRISGWKKSRVSNVLNGRGNPTFKTLWEFSRYLGYEADLIFRLPNKAHAKQPWSITRQEIQNSYVPSSQYWHINIDVQSAAEVAIDMLSGNHKTYYLSISAATNSIDQQQHTYFIPTKPTSTITVPKLEIKELACQKII